MTFTVPIHEANDCHEPAGTPAGGQFCSTGQTAANARKGPMKKTSRNYYLWVSENDVRIFSRLRYAREESQRLPVGTRWIIEHRGKTVLGGLVRRPGSLELQKKQNA